MGWMLPPTEHIVCALVMDPGWMGQSIQRDDSNLPVSRKRGFPAEGLPKAQTADKRKTAVHGKELLKQIRLEIVNTHIVRPMDIGLTRLGFSSY
jgi:hypothetical protein